MKKLQLTLIFNLLILAAFAQTSIWKVSKDGKELYLGGSVHILRPSDYPLPSEFDAAFKNAKKVVFETDISKLEDPQVAQSLMMKSIIKGDKTLKDLISDDVYKLLEAEASKVSLPLANMGKFKPSMIVLTLTMLKMQKSGMSSQGVDKYFFSKSKENEKELSYLESVDKQLEVLTSMGEGDEDNFVKYSLKDFKNMQKHLSDLISTWRDGTSKTMKKQLKDMKTEFPSIYESLLVERNNNWLPKIEGFLSDKKVEFVIVGALHLHGEDGLLSKLKNKGYNVEQFQL
ncbi:TraB/GumN family protein [Tenacibaculum sp. M341]|uniref:TraB/GumN family protein n=1 Tax=Tenacibaculum sp. M341 TaxID=2530339 RepID=UPI0010438DAC|nr:TraB/GumN family protein [Tenacibaculum sp. M341]TCI85459.1 TraB/GumN family protein [Tenacibaculum sp. M341]